MAEPLSIRCTRCGATNRVPQEKIDQGLKPVCGRCKNSLAQAIPPLVVTDATFAADVEGAALPVLVDAWAPWCGPCRMIAPVIEQLASEMAGRVRVTKLDVDENPLTASRFGLRSIPTLLLIKDGREIDRMLGVQPKAEILRHIERATAQNA
jgi:thioredoxin 2